MPGALSTTLATLVTLHHKMGYADWWLRCEKINRKKLREIVTESTHKARASKITNKLHDLSSRAVCGSSAINQRFMIKTPHLHFRRLGQQPGPNNDQPQTSCLRSYVVFLLPYICFGMNGLKYEDFCNVKIYFYHLSNVD